MNHYDVSYYCPNRAHPTSFCNDYKTFGFQAHCSMKWPSVCFPRGLICNWQQPCVLERPWQFVCKLFIRHIQHYHLLCRHRERNPVCLCTEFRASFKCQLPWKWWLLRIRLHEEQPLTEARPKKHILWLSLCSPCLQCVITHYDNTVMCYTLKCTYSTREYSQCFAKIINSLLHQCL